MSYSYLTKYIAIVTSGQGSATIDRIVERKLCLYRFNSLMHSLPLWIYEESLWDLGSLATQKLIHATNGIPFATCCSRAIEMLASIDFIVNDTHDPVDFKVGYIPSLIKILERSTCRFSEQIKQHGLLKP
jgi:hypothetical protein